MNSALSQKGFPKIRVYCVDDHTLVRLGVAALIDGTHDLTFCGASALCEQARRLIPAKVPDVVLIDIVLGDGSGLDLIRELHRHHPEIRTCAFSVHDELAYAPRALRAGAAGYLRKTEPPEEILSAIRRIATGSKVVGEGVLAALVGPDTATYRLQHQLTDREIQMVELHGEGATTTEIAAHLGVSERCISSLRYKLRGKLGLSPGGDFIRFCVEQGKNGQARRAPVETSAPKYAPW